jgi:hypothetical protein
MDKHLFKTTFQNSLTYRLPCEEYNCHAYSAMGLNKLNAKPSLGSESDTVWWNSRLF